MSAPVAMTVRLDPALHRALKKLAKQQMTSMQREVAVAVREHVDRSQARAASDDRYRT